MRLLADLEPDASRIQRAAIKGDLTELIEQLCDRHRADDAARAFLKGVAGISNKLFHLELSKVKGRIDPLAEQLVELGLLEPLRAGGGAMLHLDSGKVEQVGKTSTETERIFGWMLESVGSGAFVGVTAAADRGVAILNTMRDAAQAVARGHA